MRGKLFEFLNAQPQISLDYIKIYKYILKCDI